MKLIREEIEQVEVIVEQRNGKKKSVYRRCIFQGNIAIRNKRMYDCDILEREVKRYHENFISKGRALGELYPPRGKRSINLDRGHIKLLRKRR